MCVPARVCGSRACGTGAAPLPPVALMAVRSAGVCVCPPPSPSPPSSRLPSPDATSTGQRERLTGRKKDEARASQRATHATRGTPPRGTAQRTRGRDEQGDMMRTPLCVLLLVVLSASVLGAHVSPVVPPPAPVWSDSAQSPLDRLPSGAGGHTDQHRQQVALAPTPTIPPFINPTGSITVPTNSTFMIFRNHSVAGGGATDSRQQTAMQFTVAGRTNMTADSRHLSSSLLILHRHDRFLGPGDLSGRHSLHELSR